MGFGGQEVVINIQNKVLILSKQEEEVLEGFRQDEGIHPRGRKEKKRKEIVFLKRHCLMLLRLNLKIVPLWAPLHKTMVT